MGKLTAAKLRTLVKPGVYGDGDGLYLQVRGADQRSWIYRFKLSGHSRFMGLGQLRDVYLAEARELAAAARRLVRSGVDPIAQRRLTRAQTSARLTFTEVASAYIAAHEVAWRNARHRQQWRSTLRDYVLPTLGNQPVAAIGVGDVMQVLEPLWRRTPETASRVRGRIEVVLDFAKARGWREGENPARWRGHLQKLLLQRRKVQVVRHHAALPWREAGAFMRELDTGDGMAVQALRFAILTATRAAEVRGALWSEIDLKQATWTIPAGRMKAGREHRVPLSAAALRVLETVDPFRRADDLVFPGQRPRRPLGHNALQVVLQRLGKPDLTVHGFRSTFRDWSAEATNHPREVAEAALAHTVRDQTEAAYRRGDLIERRKQLMADWAAFCSRPLAPAEVVALRVGA